jgi:lipoprotein-anchoring transpeptidase ErfK/SrfK
MTYCLFRPPRRSGQASDAEGTRMLRAAFAGLALVVASVVTSVAMSGAALAQWGSLWDDPYPPRKPSYRPPPGDGFWGDEPRPRRPLAPRGLSRSTWSGGPRPHIARIAPDRIEFPSAYAVGSIVIDHRGRQLFFVQSPNRALRYPISVGREGFGWSGTERISKIVDWPDWRPPASMRARDPRLPAHMTGGLKNPLGAKAIYLGNTLYRIHGTNDPKSIGRAASSGCFRMLNGHVVDLASRVGTGTAVTVVRSLPPRLARIVAEQVAGTLPPQAVVKGPPVRRPQGALDDLFGPLQEEPPHDALAGEGAGAPTRPF